MSYFDDNDFDPFDDDDDQPREVSCRICGKAGLFWEDDNGQWVLISAKGLIHKCDEKALHKQTADDFEALD